MGLFNRGLDGEFFEIENYVGISPVRRSSSNWASFKIGRPSCSAFFSLAAPGDSPKTRHEVFPETLPGALPPLALMASVAPSREKPSRVPVTTTDTPDMPPSGLLLG